MTNSERDRLKSFGKTQGFHDSAYKSNVQLNTYNMVKAIGSNRTLINGNQYQGFSSAMNALKKNLK